MRAILREKFIAVKTHIEREEISQINNLTLQIKELEKYEQIKPKPSKRKKIIKLEQK